MAWISSESFYRRLTQSTTRNMDEDGNDVHMDLRHLHTKLEALIRERDELLDWKEAHERKDSANFQECEELQAKNRSLEKDLKSSRDDCNRLRSENEERISIIEGLKNELREAKRWQETLYELQDAHEKLKESNDEVEAHFAAIARDLEYRAQACRELERNRDDLQDEVDAARLELQANKKTISNLVQDCISREAHAGHLSSQLEQATEATEELIQGRSELEARIEEIGEELLMQAAKSDQREQSETEMLELRAKYDFACKKVQELTDNVTAGDLATKGHADDFDGLYDFLLGAILVLLIAFGMFGVVTGKLT